MEEESDMQPRRSSKTVGHVDEAMIASRIPPHYFHLHNPPSSHSHSPTSSLSSSRAGRPDDLCTLTLTAPLSLKVTSNHN